MNTTTPTTTQEDTVPSLTMDQAADLTWNRVSLEADRGAGHRLSADIVGRTEEGFPIVSVIHLDNRHHWNLVVWEDDPDDYDPCGQVVVTDLTQLADVLQDITKATQIRVSAPEGAWLILAEVRPNAYTTWSASI